MNHLPIRIPAIIDGDTPRYATDGASGIDLTMRSWRYFDRPADHPDSFGACVIHPGERVLVNTGLRIAVPPGYEAQVRPRSGLTLRSGVVAQFGTIDSDYRGVVGVILACIAEEPATIMHGERVAQLVFAPVVRVELYVVESLSETARGSGGFGSTGR